MGYECCRVLSGSLGVCAAKGVYRMSCITNALDCIRTEMRVTVLSETPSLRLAPQEHRSKFIWQNQHQPAEGKRTGPNERWGHDADSTGSQLKEKGVSLRQQESPQTRQFPQRATS